MTMFTDAAGRGERFLDIIRDLHTLLAVEMPSDEVQLDKPVTIRIQQAGVDFVVSFDAGRSAELVNLICDMGPPPEDPDLQRDAFARILEINAYLLKERTGAFCLQPGFDNLLFSHDFRLDDISAVALLSTIGSLTDQARRWQTTAFGQVTLPETARSREPWMRA